MPGIEQSKCVLITGATAGIGHALALSIAKLPSQPQVIAAGRRQDRLNELASSNIETVQLDVDTSTESLKKFADHVVDKYPELDTVILCAGVQHEFDFKKDADVGKLVSEMNINYTSVATIIAYLVPHFLKLGEQGRPSFIVPVTSGLGIVPAPWVPNYSASKAALHSLSISLMAQLRDTGVHVMEVIPPLVESELHDAYGTTEKLSKIWMPLDEFIKLTINGLCRGDAHISAGNALVYFGQFEKEKDKLALDYQLRHDSW
ncbi:hypothetical protein BDQ12DRAFT_678674 [Crucibulum laeve]|uniref:NAD(P)-binding protein n=1 Tax=Crucibulum laeve TaxID=68775 RepID=A0A5C3M8F8_9AGAR|nr:hypothetical protein BDQ12DRAFT_678674 [Crucibulum laeve]